MKVLMIGRAERFSPNSVGRDRAILKTVAARLQDRDCEVVTIAEERLTTLDGMALLTGTNLILTMGRLPETLAWLKSVGVRVINKPEAIEQCTRSKIEAVMAGIGTPMPPREGTHGYWLKRGDAAAQEPGDVVFAADRQALVAAIKTMEQRGIKDYTVRAHVEGDLVKFYGVRGTTFFRYFYPTDDGQTKFGDERHNGRARHYMFDEQAMLREVDRLAETIGIEMYGGDAIIGSDGRFCLIDFNDWPSFSRCREEAAEAIASLVI